MKTVLLELAKSWRDRASRIAGYTLDGNAQGEAHGLIMCSEELSERLNVVADPDLIEALELAATDWEYEIGSLKSASEHESAGKAKRFAKLLRDFVAEMR